jgi:dynamin 1-like protein
LILAISPGNYDIANSDSLKLAREVDPEGERTLGVITKMDRVEDGEAILPIIDGKVYPLSLGYVGVKCRT